AAVVTDAPAAEVQRERRVVAGQVLRIGAQRQPAGPVDLVRIEDVQLGQRAEHGLYPVRPGRHPGVPQRAGESHYQLGEIPLLGEVLLAHPTSSASTVSRIRAASSWYFSTAPRVAAARSGSSRCAPSRCNAS